MADPTPDPSTDSPTDEHRPADRPTGAPADAPADAAPPQEPAVSAEAMAEQSLEVAEEAAEAIRDASGSTTEPRPAADPSASVGSESGSPHGVSLPDFTHTKTTPAANGHAGLGLLDDINLTVTVELGRTRMYVEDVLRLNADAVVELDKAAGDPVDIFVNDRHVARGEVLVLNENFCVRISEIIRQPDLEE